MVELVLILIGIVAAFLLFFWFAASTTSRLMRNVVAGHREETEWIMRTGIAPDVWAAPGIQKIRRLESQGAPSERIRQVKRAEKKRLLRRLARHLRNLERGNVFPNQAAEYEVTDRIRNVGRSWERASWEEIVGIADFAEPPAEGRDRPMELTDANEKNGGP